MNNIKQKTAGAGNSGGLKENHDSNITAGKEKASFLEKRLTKSGLTLKQGKKYGLTENEQGIIIPYYDPDGNLKKDAKGRDYKRTRLKFPDDGAKYKSEVNAGIRVYIPADVHSYLMNDNTIPVIITEGELKAIKATEDGFPTIGIGGNWLWKEKKGSNELNPDLVPYAIPGREFIVIWDSDATDNPNFDNATRMFSRALAEYNCTLKRCDLPKVNSNGKTGLDDFLTVKPLNELVQYVEDHSAIVPPYVPGTTASELVGLELPPVKWVIPDLLPEGLTMFAGKAKLGKSWLALNLSLAVGYGGKAIGGLDVDKGSVLYLALEDNLRRLQDRLHTLTEDNEPLPDNVTFWTELPAKDLHKNLQEIQNWIKYHPDSRLVIIDTLARIKPAGKQSGDTYLEDSEFMAKLHQVAKNTNTAIVVVHHTRKAASDDPFDLVLGSTALQGTVDTTLVLKRARGEADAELHVTGRDVSENQLALKLTNGQWTYMGSAEEYAVSKAQRDILDILKRQSCTLQDLVEVTGKSKQNLYKLMQRMIENNLINRVGNTYEELKK